MAVGVDASGGYGIGFGRLMDAAEAYGADHGFGLVLDVADHNQDAIAFTCSFACAYVMRSSW